MRRLLKICLLMTICAILFDTKVVGASIRLGAGVYAQNSPINTNSAFFHLDNAFKFGMSKFLFIPEVGYIWTEEILGIKRSHYFINLDGAYQFLDSLKLRVGPGILFRTMTGSGGASRDSFSNGKPYMYPGKTQNARVLTFNIGLEQTLFKDYLIKVETYIVQLLDSEHRQFNFAVSGGYAF